MIMKKTLTLFSLLLMGAAVSAQNIISSDFVGSVTKEEINNSIGMPIFQYGADYYKLTYESKDAKGEPDTLSALMMLPTHATEKIYPILFYEHGTSNCKECVPSRFGQPGGEEGEAGLFFTGMGYITLMPDNVGMGDGRGFQTYVHDSTSFWASEDLLIAFKNWAPNNDILFNDQLFITGYSQGGYTSMSFHKAMQDKYGAESVTAATHNSGPYSLSGVMRDLIVTEDEYFSPAYIPNTMLGMNEVYEMYSDPSEFFKAEFLDDIQAYYDGDLELFDLNFRIIDTLIAHYGESVARHMIVDDVMDSIETNPNYIINQILANNDLFEWVPESPTRIYYCQADDQVPYMNSVVTIDTMYALGADSTIVKAEDVGSDLNHSGCVQPAFVNTIMFFGQYQEITTSIDELANIKVNIYPNPAQDVLNINFKERDDYQIKIIDLLGRLRLEQGTHEMQTSIPLANFENGIYIIEITNSDGYTYLEKIIVQK